MLYLVLFRQSASDRLNKGRLLETKMKISNQVFQPTLDRLEREYQEFSEELNGSYSQESTDLKAFVNKKLRQLELVRVSLSYMNSGTQELLRGEVALRDTLRQHKLELRFARRRWKRLLVSQERLRRNHERRSHVPTFAA